VDHIGEKHKTLGSRIVNLSTNSRGIKLNTFFYVSSLKNKLIYVGCLVDMGHVIAFSNYKCWMFNNLQKKIIAIGKKDENNGLYHIHTKSPLMIRVEVRNAIKLWHKKFGHLNYKNLNHVLKKKTLNTYLNLSHLNLCAKVALFVRT